MLLLLRVTFFYVFKRFLNIQKRDFLSFFALLHTFSRTMVDNIIGVGDGDREVWARAPPQCRENIFRPNVMKNSYIFGQILCKIRAFCYFFRAHIFEQKCFAPIKLTQLLRL